MPIPLTQLCDVCLPPDLCIPEQLALPGLESLAFPPRGQTRVGGEGPVAIVPSALDVRARVQVRRGLRLGQELLDGRLTAAAAAAARSAGLVLLQPRRNRRDHRLVVVESRHVLLVGREGCLCRSRRQQLDRGSSITSRSISTVLLLLVTCTSSRHCRRCCPVHSSSPSLGVVVSRVCPLARLQDAIHWPAGRDLEWPVSYIERVLLTVLSRIVPVSAFCAELTCGRQEVEGRSEFRATLLFPPSLTSVLLRLEGENSQTR